MLDILELFGFDFDNLDGGLSSRIHNKIFKNSNTQSLCSYFVEKKLYVLVILIGWFHCHRSYARYH
jgi:hypothetical protein